MGARRAHLVVPNARSLWPLCAAEVLEFDDELVASVGLGDLARRAT